MTIAEEYQAEREKLELNRALDWTSSGYAYTIAGENLVNMTVQTWFDLLAVKDSILHAKNFSVATITDYLWRHSTSKTANAFKKHWRIFLIGHRVKRALKNIDTAVPLIDAVEHHLNTSLEEYPNDRGSSTSRKKNSMDAVSGSASMVDEIASRYSMSPNEVLAMPLRRAFALQKVIRLSTIPNYNLLEPDSLRAIKSKYLQSLNNGKD
jgi:hypothetical protein